MSEEQQQVCHYLIGEALEQAGSAWSKAMLAITTMIRKVTK
jgi:hypothetical protein